MGMWVVRTMMWIDRVELLMLDEIWDFRSMTELALEWIGWNQHWDSRSYSNRQDTTGQENKRRLLEAY